jgi:hypothetical protein
VIIDHNGSKVINLGEDVEQKRVVWDWHAYWQEAGNKNGSEARPGDPRGRPYLVNPSRAGVRSGKKPRARNRKP